MVWDLYNEPGNRMIFPDGVCQTEHCPSLESASLALMHATFAWAREAAPTQPLTVGVWWIGKHGEPSYAHPIDFNALALSDAISFRAYCSMAQMRFVTELLESLGRTVFCTERMARGIGSRIADQLPHFRSRKIGAFQWGLVKGRTQTRLPWPGGDACGHERGVEWDDGAQARAEQQRMDALGALERLSIPAERLQHAARRMTRRQPDAAPSPDHRLRLDAR